MSTIELLLSVIGGLITIQVELVLLVKWLTKHYLKELIPNSGSSMKDQINRLEQRQHELYTHLLSK